VAEAAPAAEAFAADGRRRSSHREGQSAGHAGKGSYDSIGVALAKKCGH